MLRCTEGKGMTFLFCAITSSLVVFILFSIREKLSLAQCSSVVIFPTAPDSTVLIFCMKRVLVFFQVKEASKFGQEPKAQFKLNSINFYLMEPSKITILLHFFKLKAQKPYLGAVSFRFGHISQRLSLLLMYEY